MEVSSDSQNLVTESTQPNMEKLLNILFQRPGPCNRSLTSNHSLHQQNPNASKILKVGSFTIESASSVREFNAFSVQVKGIVSKLKNAFQNCQMSESNCWLERIRTNWIHLQIPSPSIWRLGLAMQEPCAQPNPQMFHHLHHLQATVQMKGDFQLWREKDPSLCNNACYRLHGIVLRSWTPRQKKVFIYLQRVSLDFLANWSQQLKRHNEIQHKPN